MAIMPQIHSAPSLATLKENVAAAVKEITRLRAENEQLSDSLQTLWAKSEDAAGGATVNFEEDRDELRARLTRYIAIIDRHLENTSA